jgi:hypothetical protein
MLGDFNEAMWQHEHLSSTKRNERQMENFREVLSDCNIHDLGFTGLPWTYNNKQKGRNNVRVRLDRAVACPGWTDAFPHAQLKHLISSRSDHCPILLNCNTDIRQGKNKRNTTRYEMMWEREESLVEEINIAWNGHANASCLQDINLKLKATMTALNSWSSLKFGSVTKEINELKSV